MFATSWDNPAASQHHLWRSSDSTSSNAVHTATAWAHISWLHLKARKSNSSPSVQPQQLNHSSPYLQERNKSAQVTYQQYSPPERQWQETITISLNAVCLFMGSSSSKVPGISFKECKQQKAFLFSFIFCLRKISGQYQISPACFLTSSNILSSGGNPA